MTPRTSKIRDLLRVDLLSGTLELNLTMEEIMADLEPDWSEWSPDSSTEADSSAAAA